eukprot:TRINITY_DN5873_c0_g2_i1.p1 TRINITY_DN5873_c0_g2~~TRINITY_DN5873_c0_g2_i1.p1  ORF type:complete len:129 (+),score=14.70 TRINITY_DN5873_c0_g2_i1:63-449(+)
MASAKVLRATEHKSEGSSVLVDLECRRSFGPTQVFSFFHPLSIGDFFICTWASESSRSSVDSNPNPSASYGISIYEGGDIVSEADPRFSGISGLSIMHRCHSGTLTRSEAHHALQHIFALAQKLTNRN